MPTLKSLLDATVKAGSKFALPAYMYPISSSFDGSSEPKYTYIPAYDGWLCLASKTENIGISSFESNLPSLFVTTTASYQQVVFLPVRKGVTYTLYAESRAWIWLYKTEGNL